MGKKIQIDLQEILYQSLEVFEYQRFYVVHERVRKTFQADFTRQDRNSRLLESVINNNLLLLLLFIEWLFLALN